MNTRFRILATGLGLAAAFLMPAAKADEEPGFYGGGSVGLSHHSDEADDIRAAFAPTTIDIDTDTNDLGWKIFGGYRFNPYLGAEVEYVDLGEESVDVGLDTLKITATNSVSGVSLSGIAGYPVLPQAYVFGRLGAFIWDSSADVKGNSFLTAIANGIGAIPAGDNDVDLTFGLGATYQLVDHVKVRADWERFQDLGQDSTDVDLFSGGIQYDF
ncbi:MAG: outer membrane beta-barrel protein [Gammaproteobacteria bacterium]